LEETVARLTAERSDEFGARFVNRVVGGRVPAK